jgi:predicted negative regulator of RcsB-dependent stress response
MATQLDLQEQEQLDAVKVFWKQYGNLITWTVTLVLAAFAGWNGWQWYQRDQAAKAGAMFDEVDKAIQAADLDKAGRLFAELRDRYGTTAFVPQAALSLARVQIEKGKADDARATLTWVADKAGDPEYQTAALLRLAGIHLDDKKYEEAMKALGEAKAPTFEGLVADRRGDVLLAQGKRAEAVAAYQAAYKALDEKVEYRRLVEAKLTSLAAAPDKPASGAQP